MSQEKRRLIVRAALMRSSTVIFSSRRNSLKRECVADLLRRTARDGGLVFPATGMWICKPKPAPLLSSIRDRKEAEEKEPIKSVGSKSP